jgi:hypothetical protein
MQFTLPSLLEREGVWKGEQEMQMTEHSSCGDDVAAKKATPEAPPLAFTVVWTSQVSYL